MVNWWWKNMLGQVHIFLQLPPHDISYNTHQLFSHNHHPCRNSQNTKSPLLIGIEKFRNTSEFTNKINTTLLASFFAQWVTVFAFWHHDRATKNTYTQLCTCLYKYCLLFASVWRNLWRCTTLCPFLLPWRHWKTISCPGEGRKMGFLWVFFFLTELEK